MVQLVQQDHWICKDRSPSPYLGFWECLQSGAGFSVRITVFVKVEAKSKQPGTELRLMKLEHFLFKGQKNQQDKLPNNLHITKVTVHKIPWTDFQRFKNYWGANKSLARPTAWCILFDDENISFDASLVIYINSTNIPPIMIIKRIYENQNLLSL